jgi:GPH family glycoside/pentoside/hexuronide:cation symporter
MMAAWVLTRSVRLWYALGQLAEGIKNDAYAVFLLFYYTSVVGLSGSLAGQAILIALLFDAVTDPLVGAYSDRLQSRWGRRHPLLLAATIPLPLFFYLSFAPPADLSQFQLFLWLTCMTVLTRGAMTLFHVPHLALGAELSSDFEERSRIVTLQMLFSRIGAGITGTLGFIVYLRPTEAFADGRFNAAAYPNFALTLAILIFIAMLLSTCMTRSVIPHLPQADAKTLAEHPVGTLVTGMREALQLRSFRALFFGTLVMFVAWGVTTSLGLHLATYFWRVSTASLLAWGVAAAVGVYAGLPFWLKRANQTDKKPVFVEGVVIFVVSTVIPPFLRVAGFWPEESSPLYLPAWILTTGVIANFGIAASMVTGRSMMADVTDEDEVRTGRRRDGVFFGATSFAAKAFFGVGSLIAGIVFDFVGLKSGMDAADAPATVVRDLGLTLGCSVLFLVGASLVIFARYDLTRDRVAELRAELDARPSMEEGPASDPIV